MRDFLIGLAIVVPAVLLYELIAPFRVVQVFVLILAVLAYLFSFAWVFDLAVIAATRRLPAHLAQFKSCFRS